MRSLRWPALALLFLLSLPAVTLRIYASDEIQYFAFLRSIYFDRDLSFDNEYRDLDALGVARNSGFRETFLQDTTPTGRRKTYATIGSALLWLPFYAVGDVVARALVALGRPVALDGYSLPYVAAACYGSAFYAWLAALLSWRVARRLVASSAAAATMAIAVGTPLVFYAYVAPLFAHATSAFAVALFLTVWLHVRRAWSPAGAVAIGLTGAVMAMVREQDIVFAALPACDLVRHLWRRRTVERAARMLAVAASAAAAFVVGCAPQAWAYLVINGGLRPAGDVARKMTYTSPHFAEVLLSPEHGLLWWTPLAVFAIAGLLALAARPPRLAHAWQPVEDHGWIGVCLLLGVGLTVYIAGSVESWTVAGAFGQRRFLSLSAILIVGLAYLLRLAHQWPSAGRLVLSVAIALCVWWNLGMAAAFGLHRMDRQRLDLAANLRTVFVDLPLEAPGLAWRYATNRESLFRLPRGE